MFLRKFLAARSPRFRRLPTIRGASILAVQPTILSPDVLIEEEEKIPGYNARNFYPVNPGDLLYNRYKTLTKVGWGTTSTVWLAQDTQRYVPANKIRIFSRFSVGSGRRKTAM